MCCALDLLCAHEANRQQPVRVLSLSLLMCAGVRSKVGNLAPTVEEPSSEELQAERDPSDRSEASLALNDAANNATAQPRIDTPVPAPSSFDTAAHKRAQPLSVRAAPGVTGNANASSQHDFAPPLATFTNAASPATEPDGAPTYNTPAAERDQPSRDTGNDATMRSTSGEQPPPDTAANEHLAALMDQGATGADHAWLPCVTDTC